MSLFRGGLIYPGVFVKRPSVHFKNGWNVFEELIEKEEYKDITGLKELLMPHINQHKAKYNANMVRLGEEEADIEAKEEEIEEYKCPCVYEEWSDWSSCSVTCGGGTQTRERGEKRPATNGGDACSTLGQPLQTISCETQSCRKYFDKRE